IRPQLRRRRQHLDNLEGDGGPSDDTARHRFVAGDIYAVPFANPIGRARQSRGHAAMRLTTVLRLGALLGAAGAAGPAGPAPAAAASRRICALYWYGRDFLANVEFDRGLQAALRQAPPGAVDYHAEYIESNRFSGPEQSIVLRDYLRRKYADRNV